MYNYVKEVEVMNKYYEKKHFYIAGVLALFMLAPILIVLIPIIIHGILYDDRTVWYINVPYTVYLYYAIGWGVFGVALLFGYFYERYGVFITLSAACVTLLCIYLGSNEYKILGDNGVAWSGTSTKHKYEYHWEDVDKVLLALPKETNGKQKFEFYFKDGNYVEFERDEHFLDFYNKFIEAKNNYGFVYESIKRE